MKNYHYLILTSVLISLNLVFNWGLQEIRLGDINTSLGDINESADSSQALSILGRMELIQNRFENLDDTAASNGLEVRLQVLASLEQELVTPSEGSSDQWYLGPVRTVVNGIRYLMGKPILGPVSPSEEAILRELQRGYLWERARRYANASRIYEEVEKQALPPDWHQSVLLHQGFCYAMDHRIPDARRIFTRLRALYPDSQAGLVALRLLGYLDSFELAWQRVAELDEDLLSRGRALFFVFDYRGAQEALQDFLIQSPRDNRIPQALYYLGRSKEEQGNTNGAISDYRSVIRRDQMGVWGQKAWTRLYILGRFYLGDEALAVESRTELEELGASEELERLDPLAELIQEDPRREPYTEFARSTGSSLSTDPDSGERVLALALGTLREEDSSSEAIGNENTSQQDIQPEDANQSDQDPSDTGSRENLVQIESENQSNSESQNTQDPEVENQPPIGGENQIENNQGTETEENQIQEDSRPLLVLSGPESPFKADDTVLLAEPLLPGMPEQALFFRGSSISSSSAQVVSLEMPLPSFPMALQEELADSVETLRNLLQANWWPGAQDFQRLRDIRIALENQEGLAPAVREELEELVAGMESRVAEKQSLESSIQNLKEQVLVLEDSYREYMAQKPDLTVPSVVSFSLGGGLLGTAGASLALSGVLGAELANTISLFSGAVGGLSLLAGGGMLLVALDEGPDKIRLEDTLAQLAILEADYRRRLRDEDEEEVLE